MKKRITFALVLLFASLPFAAPARAAEIMINAGSYDRNLSDSTPIDSNGALSWNMQHLYYDLKVREEGDYRAYGVIVTTGAEISAWIDGERVSTRPIPAVINSWSDPAPDPWPETLIGTWRLTPGTHQLHMHAGGLAMIYIRLVSGEAEEVKVYPKTAGAYKNAFLPAKIEGEDFDLGESGSFALGANEGDKNYRPGAKMNIYKDHNVSNA
jgi:hypothetical protein